MHMRGRGWGMAPWVALRGVGWLQGVKCSGMSPMNAANAHARDRHRWVKYPRGTEAMWGQEFKRFPSRWAAPWIMSWTFCGALTRPRCHHLVSLWWFDRNVSITTHQRVWPCATSQSCLHTNRNFLPVTGLGLDLRKTLSYTALLSAFIHVFTQHAVG